MRPALTGRPAEFYNRCRSNREDGTPNPAAGSDRYKQRDPGWSKAKGLSGTEKTISSVLSAAGRRFRTQARSWRYVRDERRSSALETHFLRNVRETARTGPNGLFHHRAS